MKKLAIAISAALFASGTFASAGQDNYSVVQLTDADYSDVNIHQQNKQRIDADVDARVTITDAYKATADIDQFGPDHNATVTAKNGAYSDNVIYQRGHTGAHNATVNTDTTFNLDTSIEQTGANQTAYVKGDFARSAYTDRTISVKQSGEGHNANVQLKGDGYGAAAVRQTDVEIVQAQSDNNVRLYVQGDAFRNTVKVNQGTDAAVTSSGNDAYLDLINGTDENNVFVDQLGKDNYAKVKIDGGAKNEVDIDQNQSYSKALVTATNSYGNEVAVTQTIYDYAQVNMTNTTHSNVTITQW